MAWPWALDGASRRYRQHCGRAGCATWVRDDGGARLKPTHHKDIAKPDVYNGDPDKWLKWSKNFKRCLDRNDQPHNRWSALLNKVEQLRGKSVTTADEDRCTVELLLGPMGQWRDQLKAYFQNYTSGSAKVVAEACGERKALDAWRQLADKGHSGLPLHVNELRVKAYSPKTLVPAKALEAAIALWETDVQLCADASGDEFTEANRRMFLERMCPEKL